MPVKKESHDNDRISRSTKLRKYASVYNSYVRKTEHSKLSKTPRRVRKTEKPSRKKDESQPMEFPTYSKRKELKKSRKVLLNSYQKFVQQESKKDKYKDMPGKQRLSAIAVEWKKING